MEETVVKDSATNSDTTIVAGVDGVVDAFNTPKEPDMLAEYLRQFLGKYFKIKHSYFRAVACTEGQLVCSPVSRKEYFDSKRKPF